jgi:chemotaxis protein MotB
VLNKQHEKEGHSTIVKRSSRREHDEGHGGAWKVAFADFCLALCALFLVLWLMASRQQQSLARIVRDATTSGQISGPGSKPEIVSSPRGSLIERFELPRSGQGAGQGGPGGGERVRYESPEDLARLANTLKEMSEQAGLGPNLSAVVTPFGLRVMLHDTDRQGMFMRGSPLPTPRFARLLRKMGPLFERMENQMLVVGHTDSVQYADASKAAYSNWSLSTNRGLAARAELLEGGMRKESVLQVVGMADRAPLDPASPTADVNRRIELLIMTRTQSATVAAMFGPADAKAAPRAPADDARDAEEIDKLRRQLAK